MMGDPSSQRARVRAHTHERVQHFLGRVFRDAVYPKDIWHRPHAHNIIHHGSGVLTIFLVYVTSASIMSLLALVRL